MLLLDHYLEVFKLKPGALPGSTALYQARASGHFTEVHDAFYKEARHRLGDAGGTRAMVEVLLSHRSLPARAVVSGMRSALSVGSVDPALVVIKARRSGRTRRVGGADRERTQTLRSSDTESFSLRRTLGGEQVTKMTDTAALAAIGAATRELRLPVVRQDAGRLAEVAERGRLSYLAYLAEVLSAEVDERLDHRRQRRITEARFPRVKRLSDFDLAAAPTINPATFSMLASCSFLSAGEPVVLLGDSGTGKSHLLIGLGMAACEQGRKVRYVTPAQLVNELVEAADERRLSRIVARFGRLDLLCLDELGYVKLDTRGSELLFQILTEREERASVAVASNLPFSEWGGIIGDPRLVAAIVDRLTFNAHIIETGTESFRLRTTRARGTRTRPGAKLSEHSGATTS